METYNLDDLVAMLERDANCSFCGMTSLSQTDGNPCMCCGKSMLDRQLRPSTCDPTRVSYEESNDDNVLSEIKNHLASEPAPLTTQPATRKAVVQKMPKPLKTKYGKQADDVLVEFEMMLKRDGFKTTSGGDGTARKYARYMKMLFDNDVFKARDDFFKTDSREKAHSFYREMANKKAAEDGSTTSASKLFSNFKNGFDKFVMLAHFEVEFKHPEAEHIESTNLNDEALPTEHVAHESPELNDEALPTEHVAHESPELDYDAILAELLSSFE